MSQYELRQQWMKKIQLGICPESIHPLTGRAVFVYCDMIHPADGALKPGSRPKYSIEHGSFFPHGKLEISPGIFAVNEGHTDHMSSYGEEMFPACFQNMEEVILYSKSQVLKLHSLLSAALSEYTPAINDGILFDSIKIELAAWRYFTERCEAA